MYCIIYLFNCSVLDSSWKYDRDRLVASYIIYNCSSGRVVVCSGGV